MSTPAGDSCRLGGSGVSGSMWSSSLAQIGAFPVNDLATIFQMTLVFAAVITPIVVLIRLIAGQDDYGFEAILLPDVVLSWPKGVQEEEPQPWRIGPAGA
jgi:hypothetical protein